jgi:hypothetical protein
VSLEAMKIALDALEKLWDIIDDIDTYSDMAKADEKLYRSLVERRQSDRFKETGISTDGYTLNGGAIAALRQAIEQEKKQGVITYRTGYESGYMDASVALKRVWVGLTIEDFYGQSQLQVMAMKYAEAKLKEKNT